MDVAPHPHIGLQTVTWLLDGEVVHNDSLGYESVLRPGGVNVMTSGDGIAHAEETPRDNTGRLNGVQLWTALPDEDRHGPPDFVQVREVPFLESAAGIVQVFAGTLAATTSPAPHYSDHRGHTQLLVQLTQPRFDLAAHGLQVGNNLLRAYIELGMLPEARKLLEQLYAQQRPDWREHLMHWEQKLDERIEALRGSDRAAGTGGDETRTSPSGRAGCWASMPCCRTRRPSSPRIHFVCGSGEAAEGSGGKVISQPTNELGRLSRALPMFLAEEIYLRTNARTAFLLPWMKQGGFILSAQPWTRHSCRRITRRRTSSCSCTSTRAVTPWLLNVRIENMQRNATPVVFERAFGLTTAGAGCDGRC